MKYLRVVVDSHLNFKEHIHQPSTKISRGIGILAKLHHHVTVTILKLLYFSLIYPFLIYGAINCGNTYVTTLHPLIALQKKVVRIINFSQYTDHTSQLFKDLNVIKLFDVIYYLNCIFMFKFHSYLLPSALSNLFIPISSRHKYKTRLASRSSFCIPLVRTNYANLIFSLRALLLQ